MAEKLFSGKRKYLVIAVLFVLVLTAGGIFLFGMSKEEAKAEYDGIFVSEEMGFKL